MSTLSKSFTNSNGSLWVGTADYNKTYRHRIMETLDLEASCETVMISCSSADAMAT